jgi:photosystem II stability/assembly factor-like uncharacterized protein
MLFQKLPVLFFLAISAVASRQAVIPYFPDGSYVRGMAGAGGRIFAGTDAGLFVSEDEGRTWRSVPEVQEGIQALIGYGRTALATTRTVLYRTGSDGKWERIASGDSVPFHGIHIVGNALEASYWDGRWISTDSGAHWSRVPISLALAGTRIFYNDNDGIIRRSPGNAPVFTAAPEQGVPIRTAARPGRLGIRLCPRCP